MPVRNENILNAVSEKLKEAGCQLLQQGDLEQLQVILGMLTALTDGTGFQLKTSDKMTPEAITALKTKGKIEAIKTVRLTGGQTFDRDGNTVHAISLLEAKNIVEAYMVATQYDTK